ncbi:MAG TPA: multiple cyclophane-containing RiPP AmcA [Actinoplanes sp.]|jgi:hypothetical protein
MPEIMNPQRSDDLGNDPVTARVHETRAGLTTLLEEAEAARRRREDNGGEEGAGDGDTAENGSAVCAWNHFENIPTFYNWNNRPR